MDIEKKSSEEDQQKQQQQQKEKSKSTASTQTPTPTQTQTEKAESAAAAAGGTSTDKDKMEKEQQTAPSTSSSSSSGGEEVTLGLPDQLDESTLPQQANDLLLWMARFPVQRIHPRPTTSVSAAWKSDDVMVAHTNDKAIECFRKLIIEGFLSCPIVDENDQYQGFIDMIALAQHTLGLLDKWKSKNQSQQQKSLTETKGSGVTTKQKETETDTSTSSASSLSLSAQKFWEIKENEEPLVSEIMMKPNWKSRNPFFPVFRGFSLLYVVELMARLGAHRVPVLNPKEQKVVGILTQSMAISLLDQELPRFGPLKHLKVSEIIPTLSHTLFTINNDETAEGAFKKMVELNVSGLPVVDGSSGELIDTISIRDLRIVGPGPGTGNVQLLWQPISVFKKECRKLFTSQTPDKPIFVTQEETFEKVIGNMHDGNIHRVFVCKNESNKLIPTHIITQRDVLRFFLWRCGLAPSVSPLSAM